MRRQAVLHPGGQPPPHSPVIAYGLRNPWRFSIDPVTDQIWIGDVGQNAVEEVDRMAVDSPLVDFGWSCREGRRSYNPDRCDGRSPTPPSAVLPPRQGAEHHRWLRVPRGCRSPSLRGWYVYGDFGSGRIWAYRDGKSKRIASADGLTSFGLDRRGELLLTTIDGRLLRLVA